ncbi:MAG: hypothetical protein AAGI11_06080 [Pseudomonadota bacterium]
MSPLYHELEARWRKLFSELAAGLDCPPTLRLRTEGLMEALVLSGETDVHTLRERMAEVYCECFGNTVADDLGADWVSFYPFPQIPALARRAPVFPSAAH